MSEPWLERWAEGRIGFHETGGSAALRKHWHLGGRRVLVPLCGKSVDLLWLAAQGNSVTGIELSDIAVQSFFAENDLRHEAIGDGTFRARDVDVTLHCGDYFQFDDEPFDAHYDRAALIALPPSMRPDYVRKTNTLLAPGAPQLVITVEYDQSAIDGPPYSVLGDELRGYWPGLERIDENDDPDNSPPRFRDAGVTDIREVVWRRREDVETAQFASPPCLRHEIDPDYL